MFVRFNDVNKRRYLNEFVNDYITLFSAGLVVNQFNIR